VNRKLFVFNAQGQPLYYNLTEGSNIIGLTDKGMMDTFTTDTAITLYTSNHTAIRALSILFEYLYGCRMPMFNLIDPADGKIYMKGLMDADYFERISSSFTVFIDDDTPVDKLLVSNLTGQVIKTEIELMKGYSFPFEIAAFGTAVVPKTPNSEYFLKTMKKQGMVAYKVITE
jgi:hypothetical protein